MTISWGKVIAGAGAGLVIFGPGGAVAGAVLAALTGTSDAAGGPAPIVVDVASVTPAAATSYNNPNDPGRRFAPGVYDQSFFANIAQPGLDTPLGADYFRRTGFPWPLIGSDAWLSLGYTPGLSAGGTTAMQSMNNPAGKGLLMFMPYLGIALQVGDTLTSIFGSAGLTLEQYRNNRRLLANRLAMMFFPPGTPEARAIQIAVVMAQATELAPVLNLANKQAR